MNDRNQLHATLPSTRSSTDVVQGARTYSEQELQALYALARHYFSLGALRSAELLVEGLLQVSPNFGAAWVLRSTLCWYRDQKDLAESAARHALRSWPESLEAAIIFVACLLSKNDLQSAGTFLGEIGERINEDRNIDPKLRKLYESQLARFQVLSKRS